jgi:hypothetical protein
MSKMKVAILPFFSSQDKETGKFLLEKCCTTQISGFLARKFLEMGCEVKVSIPGSTSIKEIERIFPDGAKFMVSKHIFNNNLIQRLEFNAAEMGEFLMDVDLVISHNEINSARLRRLMPFGAKLIQFNHLLPVGVNEWMREEQVASWRACDGVVFLSDLLRNIAYQQTVVTIPKFMVWPMVYSEFEARRFLGKIDVMADRPFTFLFPHRASSNNYTHHREFIEGFEKFYQNLASPVKKMQAVKAAFFDPTGYMRTAEPSLERFDYRYTFLKAEERKTYWKKLKACDAFIALMEDDFHGGVAVREAIRAGVFPILLGTPAYIHLIQTLDIPEVIPFMVKSTSSHYILEAMDKFYKADVNVINSIRCKAMVNVVSESYEKSWITASEDLAVLSQSQVSF